MFMLRLVVYAYILLMQLCFDLILIFGTGVCGDNAMVYARRISADGVGALTRRTGISAVLRAI
jgi:hypothetical protein